MGGSEKRRSGEENKSPWVCADPRGIGCSSDFIYPLGFREENPIYWRTIIRCPECCGIYERVLSRTEAEALDDIACRNAIVLEKAFHKLVQERMSEEVEFFVRALEADIIQPDDF